MGANKVPNYITGRKGRQWTQSLRLAQVKGAVVIVEETGVVVAYIRAPKGRVERFRPWIAANGERYESRDCIPVF